ncbi:THUMP-like domain-containing protein [Smaragdicoccus niigatensis]
MNLAGFAGLETARKRFGDRTGAILETVSLRGKAAGKIDGAENWLFTADALQQATASIVAKHRAERLRGRTIHDVTCSIGTEVAHHVGRAIGSDLDEVRLRMAQNNVPNVLFARADALRPCSRDAVVLVDPGRRTGGKRVFDPEALEPPLSAVREVYRGRDIAIKSAPGIDYDSLEWDGEVEIVSLDGGVREACLWSAGLATAGRRATVLTSSGGVLTVTDAEPDDIPEREPGEWIINPDGAIVRAGLVRHYAARHGLWQLDPRIAYLTGDRVPPGVRGFRIVSRTSFNEKVLRQDLQRLGCGALEILVRGVDVDPDALRKRLKLRGGAAFSLVITRIGRDATVFICEAGSASP